MSRSAGPGSPLSFRCSVEARTRDWRTGWTPVEHRVVRTGREQRKRPRGAMGQRSSMIVREYLCSCGHIGWSRHVDLLRYPLASTTTQ